MHFQIASRKIVLIYTLTSIVWECLIPYSQITLGIFIVFHFYRLFINKFHHSYCFNVHFLITWDAEHFYDYGPFMVPFCKMLFVNLVHFSIGILSLHCSKTGTGHREGPLPHGKLGKWLEVQVFSCNLKCCCLHSPQSRASFFSKSEFQPAVGAG